MLEFIRDDVDRVRDRVQLILLRRQRQLVLEVAGRDRLEPCENRMYALARERERRIAAYLVSQCSAVPSSVKRRVGIRVLATRRYTLPIMRPSGLALMSSARQVKPTSTSPV